MYFSGGDDSSDGMLYLKPKCSSYLETDMNGYVLYNGYYNVFGNLWTDIKGQVTSNWSKVQFFGRAEWAGDQFNMRASYKKPMGQLADFKVNYIRQLSDNWSLGCKVTTEQKPEVSRLPNILQQNESVSKLRFEGMLGYQKGSTNLVATLNQSLCMALRIKDSYQDKAVGYFKIKLDMLEWTTRVTWLHQIILYDNVEFKGMLNRS